MNFDPDPPCRVLLIGMMGSGKSTIGRLLAERTGWPYHDNDALLEASFGSNARALLAAKGETSLRNAEAAALRAGLGVPEPAVIGAAAGTILDSETRSLMAAAGHTVWLRASPQTLAARAHGAAHRPWLDGDALSWMEQALEERASLYESVADHVVDSEGRDPTVVVADILAWLNTLGCI